MVSKRGQLYRLLRLTSETSKTALTTGFRHGKWPILWHIWTSENSEIINFLIKNHRENSVLFHGVPLNVFFVIKGLSRIFFGVSLLVLDPFLSFSRKEPNYVVKTALFVQN